MSGSMWVMVYTWVAAVQFQATLELQPFLPLGGYVRLYVHTHTQSLGWEVELCAMSNGLYLSS